MTRARNRRYLVPALATAAFAATFGVAPAQANAQSRFEFLAPPSTVSNRIYRVDTRTGAMGVCWFNGTHTECLSGKGLAGPQTPGRYALVRSQSASEKGVFRVDQTSGAASNCWVSKAALVCTIPVR